MVRLARALVRAAGPACALLALAGPALAQDDGADEAVREAEGGDVTGKDVAFLRECLDTLAARGAPARVCVNLVAQQCASEPDGDTAAGAAACVQRESDAWQALLDDAAAELDRGMSNTERERFATAQEAWASYRDAQCAFEAALFEGESLQESERAACVRRLTADRTIVLHERASEADESSGG